MSRCTGCPAMAAVRAAALYPASMMTSGAPRPSCPAACRRRSRLRTCRAVCCVRVAGVVRSTSTSAAHAVRRCPAPRRTGTPSPGWSCGCCRSGRHRDGHDRGPGSTRHRGGDRESRRWRTAAGATVRTRPGPARPARPVPPRGPAPAGRHEDRVVLPDPGQRLRTVNELGQRSGQQRSEGLLIDLPGGHRVIQRAVTAAELRHQRQLDQRGHRVISTQDHIAQDRTAHLPGRSGVRTAGHGTPAAPGTEWSPHGHQRGIQGGRRHGRAAARRAAL